MVSTRPADSARRPARHTTLLPPLCLSSISPPPPPPHICYLFLLDCYKQSRPPYFPLCLLHGAAAYLRSPSARPFSPFDLHNPQVPVIHCFRHHHHSHHQSLNFSSADLNLLRPADPSQYSTPVSQNTRSAPFSISLPISLSSSARALCSLEAPSLHRLLGNKPNSPPRQR